MNVGLLNDGSEPRNSFWKNLEAWEVDLRSARRVLGTLEIMHFLATTCVSLGAMTGGMEVGAMRCI